MSGDGRSSRGDEHPGPLAALRVLEVGGSRASLSLLKLLEDQGARGLRAAVGAPMGEDSWATETPVTIVLDGADGIRAFLAAASTVDVVIDGACGAVLDELGIGLAALRARHEALITCALPSFPDGSGPEVSEDVLSGALGLHEVVDGQVRLERFAVGSVCAAALAAIHVAVALLLRDRDGRGAHVEVSKFGAGLMPLFRRLIDVEDGHRDTFRRFRSPIQDIYRCGDGQFVQLGGTSFPAANAFLRAIEREAWADEVVAGLYGYDDPEDYEAWRRRFAEIFERESADHWERRIASAGGACTVVRTRAAWLAEEQPLAAGIVRGPLPELVRSQPVVGRAVRVEAQPGGSAPSPAPTGSRDELPLAGVRVVDMCVIIAGPTTGRILAELGADVVKVDAPEFWRAAHSWIDVNRGKRSLLCDAKQPEGAQILWDLVERADVLLQNLRVDALERLGLGPRELATRNPSLVVTSVNAFDQPGPWRTWAGWDPNAAAATGMQWARAIDGIPQGMQLSLNDFVTGMLGAFGTVLALRERARTGGAQRVYGSLARTGSFVQAEELWRAHWRVPDESPAHAVAPEATAVSVRDREWLYREHYLVRWEHPVWGYLTQAFAHGTVDGFATRRGWPAPDPGADGPAVLRELGYTEAQIDDLAHRGIAAIRRPIFTRRDDATEPDSAVIER